MLSDNRTKVQYGVSSIHYCPELHNRKEIMFEYAVIYFWLERQLYSVIRRISDRSSEGTGSIAVLVL